MIQITLFQAHVLDALKKIPDDSIDLIVTSPPYRLTCRGIQAS